MSLTETQRRPGSSFPLAPEPEVPSPLALLKEADEEGEGPVVIDLWRAGDLSGVPVPLATLLLPPIMRALPERSMVSPFWLEPQPASLSRSAWLLPWLLVELLSMVLALCSLSPRWPISNIFT